MPLFGLGVLILWLGWFGFNPGSGLSALDGRFPEIAMVTNLAAAAGVIAAVAVMYIKTKRIESAWRATARSPAWSPSRPPRAMSSCGPPPIIGAVAGVIVVVYGVLAIDKEKIDDPVGALSAHGLAGIWGTLACGLFTAPRLAAKNAVGEGGLFYTRLAAISSGVSSSASWSAFVFVFVFSFATFYPDQEDDRAAGSRGRGGRRTGHFRARHVRGIRSSSSRLRSSSGMRLRVCRSKSVLPSAATTLLQQSPHEKDRGIHPT